MSNDLNIQICAGSNLTAATRDAILRLCTTAYEEDFTPYLVYPDPIHVLGYRADMLVSHALWVTRWLQIGGNAPRRTAYVEAVATDPHHQGRGYASTIMRHLAASIIDFELGALSPSDEAFYARLGWECWQGPMAIRTDHGLFETPDETVMILRLPATGSLDLTAPITAEWRNGELW